MNNHRMIYEFVDGRGRGILDKCTMLALYADCKRSTEVLNNHMPHEFAVSPGIGLTFRGRNAKHCEVILWYPKRVLTDYFIMQEKHWKAFRNIWGNEKSTWKKLQHEEVFSLYRSSFVYLLPYPSEPNRINRRWAVL